MEWKVKTEDSNDLRDICVTRLQFTAHTQTMATILAKVIKVVGSGARNATTSSIGSAEACDDVEGE